MTERPEQALRRIERTALLSSAVMAAAAFAALGVPGAAGVVAGAMLAALNYLAVKAIAGVIVARSAGRAAAGGYGLQEGTVRPAPRRYGVAAGFVFVLRYALLAIGAYVMLARLHLHPIGVIAGASAPVAAVAIEAIRMIPARSRTGREPRRSTRVAGPERRRPAGEGAESDRSG